MSVDSTVLILTGLPLESHPETQDILTISRNFTAATAEQTKNQQSFTSCVMLIERRKNNHVTLKLGLKARVTVECSVV